MLQIGKQRPAGKLLFIDRSDGIVMHCAFHIVHFTILTEEVEQGIDVFVVNLKTKSLIQLDDEVHLFQ